MTMESNRTIQSDISHVSEQNVQGQHDVREIKLGRAHKYVSVMQKVR